MNAARKRLRPAVAGRISLSLAAVLALWALLLFGVVRNPPSNIISWDTLGYHLYLPATVVHGDPGISEEAWVRDALNTYKGSATLYQISELPNGRWVNKYPMGMAMLWSPFFLAGHAVAGITGAPQDGFSKHYQWALIIAALASMLVGLLLLRKVLRVFFGEGITALVLALIVLGTNFLHQALHNPGMPHHFLFTLGAGVLWCSIRWYQDHRLSLAVWLGVLLGLLVVSRPSEIVWCMVPLLIGLADPVRWRDHFRSLWTWRSHLVLMAALAAMVCLPQLVYWKWITGKWLYNSYNNPGEGFEFLHPYTWEVLFSFRKGWYIYTPLMLLATLGLFALRRYVPQLQWSISTFFVLNLYIVSSWSCWWYADSFGQRALVQCYALMALPLGAVLCWLRETRWPLRAVGMVLVIALVCLNLFQFRQYEAGLIHTSRMTWPAYQAVFGTMHAPENLASLWSVERAYSGDNGEPDLSRYHRITLAGMSFDDQPTTSDTLSSNDRPFRGKGSHRLDPGNEFSPAWSAPWASITRSDHAWFRITCHVQRPADGSLPQLAVATTFEHKGESYGYKATDVHLDGTSPGEWLTVNAWYLSPEVRRPTDEFKVYCWLRDTLRVQVDEMKIDLYEPITPP